MTIYPFSAVSIEGAPVELARFRNQVCLVVNVASACGYTRQYHGLEALYQKYGGRGFTVLGFPCNQFGGQEPGTEAQIQEFCTVRFGVTFPLFARIEVNGSQAHPLFEHLKSSKAGVLGTEAIKWNFTKFLVGRDGMVRERFGPRTEPVEIEPKIEALLSEPGATA